MNKSTPTKKKPIKAHRGRIVYEPMRGGGGRPQIPRPFPRPFPGRPRPFPGLPRPRPMPFPFPPRRRPSPFVSGPPRGMRRGPQIDPRRRFDMAMRARQAAERQQRQDAARITRADLARLAGQSGNKGMAVTKKAIGENDFRKGGLTLSTVDNRKNK